jgi:hypothetical protein
MVKGGLPPQDCPKTATSKALPSMERQLGKLQEAVRRAWACADAVVSQ